MRRFDRLALMAGASLLSLTVLAQDGATLRDFDRVLPQLPGSVRTELQHRAEQWAQWSPQQRNDFAGRASAWDALTPDQRDARRARHAAWQALPSDEQRRIRHARLQFALLPPDQQQAWRIRFSTLDGSEQRGWLLGPALGVDYPALQPLLAQVPEGERAALLRRLRAMTVQQRRDLGVLAQRTPPQERAALRRGLLAATSIDDWLQDRLDR